MHMKIIVLDDDGKTLFEEDNPGYIHLPIIMDGKHDIDCNDNDCADPRCIERRDEGEKLVSAWRREGRDLALFYHLGSYRDDVDIAELERLPSGRNPRKVKIYGFTRNEIVFESGDRIPFLLPHANVYGGDQVMFSSGRFDASLCPWRDEWEKKDHKTEKK